MNAGMATVPGREDKPDTTSFSGKVSQDDSQERDLEIHGSKNLLWLLVCPK